MRHPVHTPASRTNARDAGVHDFRLVFYLPPALHLSVLPGRHQPCIAGCVLTIDDDHIVTVDGRSRESVLEQARRFLRVSNKGHGAQLITATLVHPDGATDTVHIAVDVDVVFSMTAIPPDIGTNNRDVVRTMTSFKPRPRVASR
jgi:hypothetical protein